MYVIEPGQVRSSLFQVLACRRFGVKPLPEAMLICKSYTYEQYDFIWYANIFFQENSFAKGRRCIFRELPVL